MRKEAHSKRPVKTVVWIYTEGEKTEPNYFESIRDDLGLKSNSTVQINIAGTGHNTDSLVKIAKDKLASDGDAVDYVWCVMDRDSFPNQNFNRAFDLVHAYNNKKGKRKIQIAYSNEAFELWYTLHYEYRNSETPRIDYADILSKYLPQEYKKNSPDIYHQIKDKQETAIKNAKKLRQSHCSTNSDGRHHPESDNPSTNVDELVEFLQNLAKN